MEQPVTLAAVGDICPGEHYFSLGHGAASHWRRHGKPAFSAGITDALTRAQIAICNLECPLSDSSEAQGRVERAVFRGSPEFAAGIAAAGIDIAGLANNHMSQHGAAGFHESVAALQQNRITPLGLHDTGQYSSLPVIREIAGVRLGLIAWSLVPDLYRPGEQLYARADEQRMTRDIECLAKDTDHVIVSVHGGEEGLALPSPRIVRLYDALVDSGASVVLGHHPHVFQPVVRRRHGVIAYSLGDFYFGMFWNRLFTESAVVEFSLRRDGLTEFTLTPTMITGDYAVTEMPPADSARFLDRQARHAAMLTELGADEYEREFERQRKAFTRQNAVAKNRFFARNLLRGNVLLKGGFIAGKLADRLLHGVRRAG